MKPGELVKQNESDLILIFVKFTWGSLQGQFIFPNGTIKELGTWGVKKL